MNSSLIKALEKCTWQKLKVNNQLKKLTDDYYRTVELMLFYVEVGTEFTNTYGDIDMKFYDSMYYTFDKVAMECEKDESLFKELNNRLYQDSCFFDPNKIQMKLN